jgi:hypothetical protein
MGADLVVGLFALGGVIVGALATTGSQLFLDWKRQARESEQAKRSVAGELLHVEMIFRAVVAMGHWGSSGDPEDVLPNSVWKEHRSRLAGTLGAELFERIISFYGRLEMDRSRWALACQIIPPPVIASADAIGLLEDVLELGRLREELNGARFRPSQSVRTRVEKVGDCFMKTLDRFSPEDSRDDSLVAKARCVAREIAGMRHDGGEAWMGEIEQRLGVGG